MSEVKAKINSFDEYRKRQMRAFEYFRRVGDLKLAKVQLKLCHQGYKDMEHERMKANRMKRLIKALKKQLPMRYPCETCIGKESGCKPYQDAWMWYCPVDGQRLK